MSAGDEHIWKVQTEDIPVAECGYTPPTEDIMGIDDDGEPVAVGQQIVHASPTGDTCADCLEAVEPVE